MFEAAPEEMRAAGHLWQNPAPWLQRPKPRTSNVSFVKASRSSG